MSSYELNFSGAVGSTDCTVTIPTYTYTSYDYSPSEQVKELREPCAGCGALDPVRLENRVICSYCGRCMVVYI